MYWRWIAADPFHPDRWLLLGTLIPSVSSSAGQRCCAACDGDV
jgi:hypothetical protein